MVKSNSLTGAVVSIQPILDLIDFQKGLAVKLAPNLTRVTVKPSHFNKMKVSSAMYVFSKSASAGIRYLVKKEKRSVNYFTTAWFVDLF